MNVEYRRSIYLSLIIGIFAAHIASCGSNSKASENDDAGQDPANPDAGQDVDGGEENPPDEEVADLVLLSTNDRHSHFLGVPYFDYNPMITGDGTSGGIARLKIVVDQIREVNPNTLLFDAGDFMDGTMFAVAENGAADLNLLRALGYDAVCLGNHEFNGGPEGLARMIENASEPRVPLLAANVVFGEAQSDDQLEAMWGSFGDASKAIYPSVVLTTDSGVKVGVFGLTGQGVNMPEASPVTFAVDFDEIQILVDGLRNDQAADVVVLLVHAGLSDTDGELSGEVADIAENVVGIDVIMAGHSHNSIEGHIPSIVPGSDWTTTVVEAVDEATFLGRVNLYLDKSNHVLPEETTTAIVPIDDSQTGDPAMVEYGLDLVRDIEENYLTHFPPLGSGGVFDELARSSFPLERFNSMYLVTDAMREIAGSDIALVSQGGDEADVRTNGPDYVIQIYDAFNAMRRGKGLDGLVGSPIYKFHLTLQEMLIILEATVAFMGQDDVDYLIVPSGLRIVFDTEPLLFQRIMELYLVNANETEETTLYDRAAGGWQNGYAKDDILSLATSSILIYGLKELNSQLADLLSPIEPRDASGVAVPWKEPAELSRFIVKFGDEHPEAYRGNEIKTWYSVAKKLESFGDSLPSRYDETYTDGTTNNPIGPPHRRVWNVQKHGQL